MVRMCMAVASFVRRKIRSDVKESPYDKKYAVTPGILP